MACVVLKLIMFSFFLTKIKSHAEAILANGIFLDEANTKAICTREHTLRRACFLSSSRLGRV